MLSGTVQQKGVQLSFSAYCLHVLEYEVRKRNKNYAALLFGIFDYEIGGCFTWCSLDHMTVYYLALYCYNISRLKKNKMTQFSFTGTLLINNSLDSIRPDCGTRTCLGLTTSYVFCCLHFNRVVLFFSYLPVTCRREFIHYINVFILKLNLFFSFTVSWVWSCTLKSDRGLHYTAVDMLVL